MFVSQSMTRNVITIRKETPLTEVTPLLSQHKFRHLPVVSETGTLIGIVTDRDIRSAMPYDPTKGDLDESKLTDFNRLTAADIMSENPTTISPTNTLQDALLLIGERRVGAFPVVDENGKLCGILSVRDLLRAFVNVMGIGKAGTLLGIVAEEKIGQLKKIVNIITEENVSMGSILVSRHWEENKRAVFPYLFTNNVIRIKQRLTEEGFEVLNPMQWYLDQLPREEAK